MEDAGFSLRSSTTTVSVVTYFTPPTRRTADPHQPSSFSILRLRSFTSKPSSRRALPQQGPLCLFPRPG